MPDTASATGKQVFIGDTPVADAYREEAAARIVAALNAGDLDLPPAETRAMLPPDEEDIRMVLHGSLPRCPCCQGTPTTFARHFPHSGIYQAYVHCSHCDVQVFKNARDLDEARQLAIATWSKRPTPPDNNRPIAASLNSLADRCKQRGVARGLRVAADHVQAGLWEETDNG